MRVPLSKIQANRPSGYCDLASRRVRAHVFAATRRSRRRNGEPAMPRSSIYVGEMPHQPPIPKASRIGNIIVSGLIRGADPATASGGATVEDIIKVTVWMKEL